MRRLRPRFGCVERAIAGVDVAAPRDRELAFRYEGFAWRPWRFETWPALATVGLALKIARCAADAGKPPVVRGAMAAPGARGSTVDFVPSAHAPGPPGNVRMEKEGCSRVESGARELRGERFLARKWNRRGLTAATWLLTDTLSTETGCEGAFVHCAQGDSSALQVTLTSGPPTRMPGCGRG